MKKGFILFISSLLILTSCSYKAADASAEIKSETTMSSTAASTETTFETTTEQTEAEVSMTEIKIEEMTLKIDPSVWETPEEYIKRMEENGTPLDDTTKEEMTGSDYGTIFVLRDTDAILVVFSSPYDGINGFGTKEDYELLSEALEYSQQKYNIDLKSTVTERNGIMMLDSITYDSGLYSQTCSVLKDNVQYSFVYSYYSVKDERGYFYDLIDSVVFD